MKGNLKTILGRPKGREMKFIIEKDPKDDMTYHAYYPASDNRSWFYAFTIFKDVLSDLLGENKQRLDQQIKKAGSAAVELWVVE